MKRKSSTLRPRPAFTIIEFMAVIAIISVLLAILGPTLRRIRTITKETICAADTRTLVQATLLYATQYKGYMPDMSENPETGTLVGTPYWTWPPWRRFFESKYGISHRQWYSLSNPRWGLDRFYYWGWDGVDPDTATNMVMGRFYFGSERRMNTDAVYNAMIGLPAGATRPLFPSSVSKKSYYKMLWTDLNRQWPATADTWWITPGDPDRSGANHLYGSGETPLDNWPQGSHVGYIDGSVGWTKGSDILHRITIGSAEMYW